MSQWCVFFNFAIVIIIAFMIKQKKEAQPGTLETQTLTSMMSPQNQQFGE